jgi:hypothetical protein
MLNKVLIFMTIWQKTSIILTGEWDYVPCMTDIHIITNCLMRLITLLPLFSITSHLTILEPCLHTYILH